MKINSLLSGNIEAIEALPIEKRATIPNGLPLELSIKDISKLVYPDDTESQNTVIKMLVKCCEDGDLTYYGDIKGWSYTEPKEQNPFPKVKDKSGVSFGMFDWYCNGYAPENCLIHRDDFEAYLKMQKKWPLDGLLANWWNTDKQKAKAKAENSDYQRTSHVREWVERTGYTGGKPDKTINAELNAEKSDLWGDKMYTFQKWIQSDEAVDVKALLPNPRRK